MFKFKNLLLFGIALELTICLVCFMLSSDLSETFKYAARFSGRFSLVVFLASIILFANNYPQNTVEFSKTRSIAAVFAILHYIHLALLFMNVKLNALSLIPHKLAGGALAYLMILLYPIFFERIKSNKAVHITYFLYVSFVMSMTYIARLKGEFEGADPELFHKAGLGLMIASTLYFIYSIFIKKRLQSKIF